VSTEIAPRDDNQAVATQAPALPAVQPTAGTTALVAWAQEANLAYDMAQKLAATSFVPQSLRGKPGDIAAAILAGSELGLKPMATLKSIDIIQGTPALRAHAMRAVIQTQGHDIELVHSDDTRCVMRGRRAGSETWQEVEWTTDRARLMGLLGKDQWKKNPKGMLVARATGDICRLIASDALHGMPYAAEEYEGFTTGQVLPAKPPLSVAAITSPPTPAGVQRTLAAEEPPAAEAEYSVARDDEPADGVWDHEAASGSTDWPEPTQPGGGA